MDKKPNLGDSPKTPEWLDERRCRLCGMVKPLADFQRDKNLPLGRRHRCKQCVNAIIRRTYEKNPSKKLSKNDNYRKQNWEAIKLASYERRDPFKQQARQAVNNAVAAGKFKKAECEVCDSPNTDFHHTNGYDKENWFVGEWLCRKHHAQTHKELRWQTT